MRWAIGLHCRKLHLLLEELVGLLLLPPHTLLIAPRAQSGRDQNNSDDERNKPDQENQSQNADQQQYHPYDNPRDPGHSSSTPSR